MKSSPGQPVGLEVNNQRVPVNDPGDFEAWLEKIRGGEAGEYWLIHGRHGNLCLLSNGAAAFLMHLPDADGAHPGFTARNKRGGEPVSFRLANGQVDRFPGGHVISLPEAAEGFRFCNCSAREVEFG